MVLVISETLARELVGVKDAIAAVETAFTAMVRGDARNYPVVREVLGYRDAVFGVKTGADVSAPFLGLKAGGYWPGNLEKGMTNHQSSTLLFDPETGQASALVSANYLTGLRTGAASAIATKYLAKPDAEVLTIIGTGGQAPYQLEATLAVRDIKRVHAWNPSPQKLAAFADIVTGLGLDFVAETDRERAVRAADVVITVTPSRAPLIEKDWVRPGTHISAMGTDTKGKQELSVDLVAAAEIFVDEAAQALTIGECQHAFAAGRLNREDFATPIGAVIAGDAHGRKTDGDITLFDGTGVSLQDLVVADLAARLAAGRGLGATIDYA